MSDTPTIFVREPRDGGYTFVTAPDFPGFSMMLEPGEGDDALNACFLVFLAADLEAAKRRPLWRPIDEAPKDGRPILSWDGDTYAVVVYCGCEEKWYLVECSGNKPYADDGKVEWPFKGWTPLPPPPATLITRGGGND